MRVPFRFMSWGLMTNVCLQSHKTDTAILTMCLSYFCILSCIFSHCIELWLSGMCRVSPLLCDGELWVYRQLCSQPWSNKAHKHKPPLHSGDRLITQGTCDLCKAKASPCCFLCPRYIVRAGSLSPSSHGSLVLFHRVIVQDDRRNSDVKMESLFFFFHEIARPLCSVLTGVNGACLGRSYFNANS